MYVHVLLGIGVFVKRHRKLDVLCQRYGTSETATTPGLSLRTE